MKKTVLIIFAAGILAVTGCSERPQNGSEQTLDHVISENILLDSTVSENEISENYIAVDETPENNDGSEGINKDDIVNMSGVLDCFWEAYYNAPREITVGDYNEKFPIELQNLLVDCNDDIEGDIDWGRYAADYEIITPEDAENRNIPHDEILAAAREWGGTFSDAALLYAVDVDADGDDEYMVRGSDGIGWQSKTLIIKHIESEWVVIGGGCGPEDTSSHDILDYDGRYYLLLGDVLAYWNDEIESPTLSYWKQDVVLGYDDCWNELEIQKTVISYTPYEIYTNVQDNAIDYLAGMDLETLESNNAEDVDIEDFYWHFDGIDLSIKDSWLSYGEEQYLYVITNVSVGRNGKSENDRILMILNQTEGNKWEFAKVYYLAANYNVQFRMRKSQ